METNGTIVLPAAPEYFDCGRQMHRLADELLFGNLNAASALTNLAGKNAIVCMIRSNGRGVIQPMSEWTTSVDEERKEWIRVLAMMLNTMLHNNGAWVTAWNNDREFMAIWFDPDGDVKVALDDQRPFARMAPAGPDYILSNCQLALQHMVEHERELEITPDQQIKAAQGETFH